MHLRQLLLYNASITQVTSTLHFSAVRMICPALRYLEEMTFLHRRLKATFFHTHLLQVIIFILFTTELVISFPSYLDAINKKSDVNCALLFTSLCSFIILLIVVVIFKIVNNKQRFIPPCSSASIWKLGTCLGFSIVLIYQARDRDRVTCHLQDPLAALLLPITLVLKYSIERRVESTRKLFCLATAIVGLFISVDFQLWDEYNCHGQPVIPNELNSWTSKERAMWLFIYINGIIGISLWFVYLDKLLKDEKAECKVATISLTPTATPTPNSPDVVIDYANQALIPSTPDSIEVKIFPISSNYKPALVLTAGQVLVLAMWIQFYAFCSVLLFFWTDSFFRKNITSTTLNGIKCHFSTQEECGGVIYVSWFFILLNPLMLVSLISLLNNSRLNSLSYVVTTMMLVFPLSSIYWSLAKMDGDFKWTPSFSGEIGFALVGLPIIIGSIAFYRHYAKKENKH